jgi:hypothetical protein
MTQLTNTGLSAISKTHEDVMQKLFNLTVRPPKKIEIVHISEEVTLDTQDGISYHLKPVEYYGEVI